MSPLLRRFLQEPTLHFFVIALVVFAIYALSQSGRGQRLEIDPRDIQARIFMLEMARGTELSEAEMAAVRDAYIEEQILVQEALARNLEDDARIHDLLAQKMRHVLSAEVIQPDDEQLAAFYAANQARYEVPARISLDELVFDSREALAPEVQTLLDQGSEAEAMLALAEGTVTSLDNATRVDLENIFSLEFADRVFAATADQWVGPYLSNRGQHWLRIRQRQDARIPPLDELRERLRLDWIAAEEEALLQERVDALRSKYKLVFRESAAE